MRHKAAWSAADSGPTTGFASLAGRKYALLITYRKDGQGVPSPVWFGRDEEDRVYFDTEEAAGKVKRIRNNPEVVKCPGFDGGSAHWISTRGWSVRFVA
ncbi:hypothetical protein AWB95_11685 [Mycobacterium celatum]|uniref:Uncharacterized protein n=3 Tax=Mycobacterium celatum TaxID=28045 RepID=A0A1X1RRI9_MYCCE|nr:hypothetical protein AWB95_11685 [Mycobacterium celatum]PIB78086.1 hypothetical protein CQY23_15185 [Mycobacterium celatum]